MANKYFFSLLLIALIIASGCNNSNNPVSLGPSIQGGITLQGKASDWVHTQNAVKVAAFFLGSDSVITLGAGTIDTSGSFNINFITPPFGFLAPIRPPKELCTTTYTASNPAVLATNNLEILLEVLNVRGDPEGFLLYVSDSAYTGGGAFSGLVTYVNADVSLTGSTSCPRDASTGDPPTKITYNLLLTKGWNVMYDVSITATESLNADAYVSTPPAAGKWKVLFTPALKTERR